MPILQTAQRQAQLYSDFTSNLSVHPVKGDLLAITNENAVKQSIKNILLTRPYERHWLPEFGSGLAAYLFEPISPITETGIKESIKDTIQRYEPRAELIEVYVSAVPDQNGYTATIVFATRNLPEPITMKVFLERVR